MNLLKDFIIAWQKIPLLKKIRNDFNSQMNLQ